MASSFATHSHMKSYLQDPPDLSNPKITDHRTMSQMTLNQRNQCEYLLALKKSEKDYKASVCGILCLTGTIRETLFLDFAL